MQSDTIGGMGGLGAAMFLTQNTQKIFGVEAQAHLQYKTSNDKGLWLILADYNSLKVGGDKESISNYFIHLRYNYKVTQWLRWEIFTQYMNNDVTQIDSRLLTGTGPRFKIIKISNFRLYAGTLLMYESEKELTQPVIQHKDWRNSDYISFTWILNKSTELISTTYFQPMLSKLKDYRILNQAVFKVKASPHFSLSVKWNYLHDRYPVDICDGD
jgi:uncharacterized protein with ParB-like and HNH nuclease domain